MLDFIVVSSLVAFLIGACLFAVGINVFAVLYITGYVGHSNKITFAELSHQGVTYYLCCKKYKYRIKNVESLDPQMQARINIVFGNGRVGYVYAKNPEVFYAGESNEKYVDLLSPSAFRDLVRAERFDPKRHAVENFPVSHLERIS